MLGGCGLAQEMLKKLPNVALMAADAIGWPFRVVHAFNGCRGEIDGSMMVLIRLGCLLGF